MILYQLSNVYSIAQAAVCLKLYALFIHSIHIAHLFKCYLISSYIFSSFPFELYRDCECVFLFVNVCVLLFFLHSVSPLETFTVQNTIATRTTQSISEKERWRWAEDDEKKWMSCFPFLLKLSSVVRPNERVHCLWPKTIDLPDISSSSQLYRICTNSFINVNHRNKQNLEIIILLERNFEIFSKKKKSSRLFKEIEQMLPLSKVSRICTNYKHTHTHTKYRVNEMESV